MGWKSIQKELFLICTSMRIVRTMCTVVVDGYLNPWRGSYVQECPGCRLKDRESVLVGIA